MIYKKEIIFKMLIKRTKSKTIDNKSPIAYMDTIKLLFYLQIAHYETINTFSLIYYAAKTFYPYLLLCTIFVMYVNFNITGELKVFHFLYKQFQLNFK